MNVRSTALVFCALAVAGCTPAEPEGDPAVLERINSLEDCADLQEEFEIAYDNTERADPGTPMHKAATEYMAAADDRLAALGCYE